LALKITKIKKRIKEHWTISYLASKIIPIFQAIDYYAKEKARLRKSGKSVDDFDLLIGSTAITFWIEDGNK